MTADRVLACDWLDQVQSWQQGTYCLLNHARSEPWAENQESGSQEWALSRGLRIKPKFHQVYSSFLPPPAPPPPKKNNFGEAHGIKSSVLLCSPNLFETRRLISCRPNFSGQSFLQLYKQLWHRPIFPFPWMGNTSKINVINNVYDCGNSHTWERN